MTVNLVVALLAVTFLIGTLVGHSVHWAMHQRWSGPFYRSHMTHHLEKYPRWDLLSKGSYRSSGLDSGWFAFTPPIAVFVVGVLFLLRYIGVPVGLQIVVAAEYGVIGFLHGYVHDAFHIEGHWLERSRWFMRLRDLHAFHHRAMRTNLGIFWFGWDRAFGTFKSVKTPK